MNRGACGFSRISILFLTAVIGTGVFVYKIKSKQTVTTTKEVASTTASPLASSSETVEKIFTNFDYTVKYPEGFTISERPDKGVPGQNALYLKNDQLLGKAYITIETWVNTLSNDMKQFLYLFTNAAVKPEDTTPYKISDLNGINYILSGNRIILIQKDDKVFVFGLKDAYDTQGKVIGKKYEDTFYQILSTFKFTETQTAQWKAYTHPQLKFSLKYPDDIVPIRESPDGVTFVRKNEGNPDRSSFTISLLIALSKDTTAQDALKTDMCEGCSSTTEKARINNGVGLQGITGFASLENYYLMDISGKGPVLRLYLSPNNKYSDYDTFKKVLSTFRFSD
ncbi:MAG: hypothetical protein Q8P25_01265 [Candidatus Curtissbacteria bacterium]|nr:hypothetical protein [Candidatus Curtissbacteria bacterium]